jgi:hypothetical protein
MRVEDLVSSEPGFHIDSGKPCGTQLGGLILQNEHLGEREHKITITNTSNNFLYAAANFKTDLESSCLKNSITNI